MIAESQTQAVAKALEWDRLVALAQREALSDPGKARVLRLLDPEAWARDISTARLAQQETQEVSALLDRDGLWSQLGGLPDPSELLELLKRGGVLELSQLVTLRRWLYACDAWVQMPREEIRGERFKKALMALPDPLEPLRALDRVLTPEGELSEKASPKLSGLFSEVRSLRKEISQVLDQLLKTFSQKGVLQENFTDIRDGRYVLPVKISSQNEVEGIIYEASASGQTVFVEPKEVSALNNRLRQRQNDLLQEIHAVLKETSSRLAPFAGEIEAAAGLIAHWDATQAKARLGRHYGGKAITVIEERVFILHQSAHPLLWWSLSPDTIIRNEIEFGGTEPGTARTLLITGPNTGGKTVLLKTLGIAALCARTGFPFPGTDQPTVPFFESVFADLGDPQSIEQHLSSFSGHILRLKQILENLTGRSLILLDELNSATDPEEGAALGRAFLETVMGSEGAMLVATTHDPRLKALAVSDPRIVNSSMAFDERTRTPTYRLVIGVPGRSRALETAERLGIPARVLDLAKTYLSREHQELEGMLSRLEADVEEAARARKESVQLREEAERAKKEWTERTESSVNDLLEKTRQRLRRVLEQAQDEVRASVRKLDELQSRREIDKTRAQINQVATQASARFDLALQEEAPSLAETLSRQAKAAAEKTPSQFEAGMAIRVPKWKSTGVILDIQGNKIKVGMGTLQVNLSLSDIEPMSDAEKTMFRAAQGAQKKNSQPRISTGNAIAAPPSQLDLRGIRFDEAMRSLETYLDQAYRSGALREVTIVHGLGTGSLREGTRKILKDLPYVKEFKDGGSGRGGSGATVVEFD